MSNKRKWEYTLQDIADSSKQSINTVRDHKQQGVLEPDKLTSVARYIISMRQLHAIRNTKKSVKGMLEVDEWGNPTE